MFSFTSFFHGVRNWLCAGGDRIWCSGRWPVVVGVDCGRWLSGVMSVLDLVSVLVSSLVFVCRGRKVRFWSLWCVVGVVSGSHCAVLDLVSDVVAVVLVLGFVGFVYFRRVRFCIIPGLCLVLVWFFVLCSCRSWLLGRWSV